MENKLIISAIILIVLLSIKMVHAGWGEGGWGEGGWGEELPSVSGGGGGGGGGDVAIPSAPYLEITNETALNEAKQRYDVSIKVDNEVYEFNQSVKATIQIINKGDIPDEDTVMIYWLSNPLNKKFGEAREQFLEVPIGTTKFLKVIDIPEEGLSGEWRFNVEYHTNFQATITVFDSFIVKEKFSPIDYIKNASDKAVSLFAIIALMLTIYFVARKEYMDRKNTDGK